MELVQAIQQYTRELQKHASGSLTRDTLVRMQAVVQHLGDVLHQADHKPCHDLIDISGAFRRL